MGILAGRKDTARVGLAAGVAADKWVAACREIGRATEADRPAGPVAMDRLHHRSVGLAESEGKCARP